MPDYDPSALNEAKARFEEHLQSSQAGAEVLEILTSRHGWRLHAAEMFHLWF
jgi:hypothetical protein